MEKRPFTVPLNGSLTALLHLSDNVLVIGSIFYSFSFPPPPSTLNQGEASWRFQGESARHSPPDLDLLAGGCLVPKWLVATVLFTRGVLEKCAVTPHLRFRMALSLQCRDRSSFHFFSLFPPHPRVTQMPLITRVAFLINMQISIS